MPKLTYEVGGERRTVEVADSCSIGRAAGNTIALEQETGASRRHCQIVKLQSGYELADLGSTNGTLVNGEKVKRRKLAHGDRIGIGETELLWEEEGAADVELEEEISLEEVGPPRRAPAPAAAAAGENCYLVHAGGERDGQRLELGRRITFGRNPKNDVQLQDAMVSGFHCEIVREGGAYVLRDLGSTNGTLLDGEPVSESALQHGARLRVGNTRLVFVDPSVSDFEKAMAAVDDLGSEWGLLRAEMDLSRVQRARRSQAVAIAAFLVVLGGAGWFVFANPDFFASRGPEIARLPRNLVPAESFSFESAADSSWAPLPGTPASVRLAGGAEARGAHQGGSWLEVLRDGAAGAPAAAHDERNRYRISPGAAYEFGAHVKASGGALAAVRVAWMPPQGDDVLSRVSTPLSSASDWTEVRGRAVAPSDAGWARVELLNAADGTAAFDDLLFRESEQPPEEVTVTAGNLELRALPDGQVTFLRNRQPMLRHAAVVAGAVRTDALDDAKRGDRSGSAAVERVERAGEGLVVAGRAFDPQKGELVPFELRVTIAEGRWFDVTGDLPPEGALVGELSADRNPSIQVATGTANLGLTERRLVEGTESVLFGAGPAVFEVRAAGEPFRFAAYGALDTVAFGAGSGKLALRIDTDAQSILARVAEVRREAQTALQRRTYGEAIRHLGALAGLLPEGNPEREESQREAERLRAQGAAEVARIGAERRSAEEFNDFAALNALHAQARDLEQQYEGNDVATAAAAERAAIRQAIDSRRAAVAERLAEPLLLRADDYRGRGSLTLAAALYRGIVERFPGTRTAESARARLAELGQAK